MGVPEADQTVEEFIRLCEERFRHQPSFQCFGGHLELRPPVPQFWEVHWETLVEE